jgi:hypothetical protein
MFPRRAGGPAAAACFALLAVGSNQEEPPRRMDRGRRHLLRHGTTAAGLPTLRFDKLARGDATCTSRLHPPPAGHPRPRVWRASWLGMAASGAPCARVDRLRSATIGHHKDDMAPAKTKI